MQTSTIAIVGGGLSGLYAAYLLEQMGMRDYVVLEARETVGGRIASVTSVPQSSSRFDLGPTWFWPDMQSELNQLTTDFGLAHFGQHLVGDAVLDYSSGEVPRRVKGYDHIPVSMRLMGSMSTLVEALAHRINPERIALGQQVCRLRRGEQFIELDSEHTDGGPTTWRTDHVLLALPPRLAVQNIEFAPALPPSLALQWRAAPTWMAAHAKYVAVYDTPFWREIGCSGEARSMLGPLGEIHDASMPGGDAAIFGFFGIPYRTRRNIPDEVLRTHCRAQLARLFGSQASTPQMDVIKDWASDPYTATADDWDVSYHHQRLSLTTTPGTGPWSDRLMGIASEWSPQFPGYVAGALEAVRLGVKDLCSILEKQR